MQTIINGLLTHYEIVNPKAKNPVIILHGWGSSSSYWAPLTGKLPSDHVYYLIDLPSFGGTQNLQSSPDVPDYTDFVKSFIEKLKLKKITLVGHSFGGQITIDFSIKYPKVLNKIVLIAPAGIRHRTPITRMKIALTKTIKPLLKLVSPKIQKQILALYTPKDYQNANPHQRSVLNNILKYNLENSLRQITVPTHIIWGSEDHVIPYKGKFMADNIKNSRLHVIYGAGHLIHLSHPDKLVNILNPIITSSLRGT